MSLNHFVGYVNMHEYKRIVQFYEHQLNGILINNLKLNRNPFKILYSKCFPFSHPSTKKKSSCSQHYVFFSIYSLSVYATAVIFFFGPLMLLIFHSSIRIIYKSLYTIVFAWLFYVFNFFFRCCSVSRMLFFVLSCISLDRKIN